MTGVKMSTRFSPPQMSQIFGKSRSSSNSRSALRTLSHCKESTQRAEATYIPVDHGYKKIYLGTIGTWSTVEGAAQLTNAAMQGRGVNSEGFLRSRLRLRI